VHQHDAADRVGRGVAVDPVVEVDADAGAAVDDVVAMIES
jgi:hypothetical protein